ncbi:hypothetical protein ACEQ6C_38135, partial [Rhizobium ruizarguesonis]
MGGKSTKSLSSTKIGVEWGIFLDETPYAVAILTAGIPYNQQRSEIAKLASLIHKRHTAITNPSEFVTEKLFIEKDNP